MKAVGNSLDLDAGWGAGGAITLFRMTQSVIENSQFNENVANVGIVYYNYDLNSNGVLNKIKNCNFFNNTAGAVITAYNATLDLSYTYIGYTKPAHNIAAAATLLFSAETSISHCTFVGS